jgi:N-acetylneuraminic acid mutarotase
MNKKAVSLLITLIFSVAFIFAAKPTLAESNAWTTKTSMQVARSSLGAAVVNDQIYAIGGVLDPPSWIQCTNINEKYNPALNTWIFKASMPTARASFAIVAFNNKIYCIGGTTGVKNGQYVASEANEVYDPQIDTWTTKASIPTPRVGVTASVVEGKIYLIGGNSNITEVYDPATDKWTTKASIPVKPALTTIWSCTSAVIDEKIHIFGAFPYSNSHQVYNPKTDSWNIEAPIIQGYYLASASTTAGVKSPEAIYVFAVDSTWWDLGPPNFTSLHYDPVRQSWREISCMPTPRVNVAVAVVDDLVYVIGGSVVMIENNSHPTTIVEVYSPLNDTATDKQTPKVTVLTPETESYSSNVQVNFTVNKPTSMLLIGVDDENLVSANGNMTLNLQPGKHNITIYAVDTNGNVGSSDTIKFTIIESQQFPISTFAVFSAAIAVCLAIGLIFFIKRKKHAA